MLEIIPHVLRKHRSRLRNALALIAHREDHHPDLSVHFDRCVVRFNTHDAGGISKSDLDCAQQADALLQPTA